MPVLFGESEELPDNFKKMTEHFSSNTAWHEWVFASVIYVFLECGFEVIDKHANINTSESFNMEAMNLWKNYKVSELYNTNFKSYSTELRLGVVKPTVILQGKTSSMSLCEYMVINAVTPSLKDVHASCCFRSFDYTVFTELWVLKKKKSQEFALRIKNSLVNPIKNSLLVKSEYRRATPVLQFLPELLLQKIRNYMSPIDGHNFDLALH